MEFKKIKENSGTEPQEEWETNKKAEEADTESGFLNINKKIDQITGSAQKHVQNVLKKIKGISEFAYENGLKETFKYEYETYLIKRILEENLKGYADRAADNRVKLPDKETNANVFIDEKINFAENNNQCKKVFDIDKIRTVCKKYDDYVEEKLSKNNLVVLGETHMSEFTNRKVFLSLLDNAKNNGFNFIGLEIPEIYQDIIDNYIATGEPNENDNADYYEKSAKLLDLWSEINKDNNDLYSIKKIFNEGAGLDLSSSKDSDFFSWGAEYFEIFKKCRQLGISIKCIDSDRGKYFKKGNPDPHQMEKKAEIEKNGNLDNYFRKKEIERDKAMFRNVKKVVNNGDKILVIVGKDHIMENSNSYKNFGDLLIEENNKKDSLVKSFRIDLSQNIDENKIMISYNNRSIIGHKITKILKNKLKELEIVFNSPLYNALNKAGLNNIGFDLTPDLFKTKEPLEMPFDGYIKI